MIWIVLVPILILSIVGHEVAHAWAARREGDDTAERAGRLTLNPLPHLDPVGSFLVPAVLIALPGSFIFGWARPVPVDPRRFRDPVAGDIRVSMAGPASNLLLVVLFAALLVPAVALAGGADAAWDPDRGSLAVTAAFYGIVINLILAIFNLIPVPPLDGSHVLRHLLPPRLQAAYLRMGSVGVLLLLGVLFLVPGALDYLFLPVEVAAGAILHLVTLVTG